MQINNQQTTFNFKALVPKSQYKGPVLKLTPQENKRIGELLSRKSLLILKLTEIEELLKKKTTTIGSLGLFNQAMHLEGEIAEIEQMILEIKQNRLAIQKENKNLDITV